MDHKYNIYVRTDLRELSRHDLDGMLIDILEKLAIVCDKTDRVAETWTGIDGIVNEYRFTILRVVKDTDGDGEMAAKEFLAARTAEDLQAAIAACARQIECIQERKRNYQEWLEAGQGDDGRERTGTDTSPQGAGMDGGGA